MRALVKAGQDRASPMDVYRSREASEADIVLLYAREDERQMGALVEAGCALGAGKQVYLVAPWAKWSFRFIRACAASTRLSIGCPGCGADWRIFAAGDG